MRQSGAVFGLSGNGSGQTPAVPRGGSMVWARGFARFVALGVFLTGTLAGGTARALFMGRRFNHAAKAKWLQKVCKSAARVIHLEIRSEGPPPKGGLLVCNHLGYLDIIALGSVTPLVFLSKREVQGWPLIGAITRLAGTLFIAREQKDEVVRLAGEFEELAARGTAVAIFPEGTSSDGTAVLPFKSALLEPAVRNQWPVTPAWLGYQLKDGSVEDEVCYWRDMTFFPHLLNLLTKERVFVSVRFAPAMNPGACRKELARALRQEVCALGGSGGAESGLAHSGSRAPGLEAGPADLAAIGSPA